MSAIVAFASPLATVLAFARRHRAGVTLAFHAAVTAVAYLLAFQFRFEFDVPSHQATLIAASLPALVLIRLASFTAFRLARTSWRYTGTADVLRLGVATATGTLAFMVADVAGLFGAIVPRSIILIEAIITANCTAGVWLFYRLAYEQLRIRRPVGGPRKRVLILGAGEAGHFLAREIQRSPVGYRLVAFVDDDPVKWGTQLCDVPVLGSTLGLERYARAWKAEELLVAMPSAAKDDLRRVIEACETTGLPIKILPGAAEVLNGEAVLHQLREVRIEDLLGREPVKLELPELAADLEGRAVLITGAAGSIGSELSRQVALHRPGVLVLFDQAETEMYYLELELREKHPGLHIVPVIGDIVHAASVERVFREYAPQRVFHAAAYKHVPMMECNIREAIHNNVIGTHRVADAAGRHGAERFVLVSTDKAVRPSSVMGASKRLAELVVLEAQEAHPETTYCAVRFGNVLGSAGSVLPIFRRQLEAGKPLTVTHPDVTRYFMTIPEAVQLILQASILPEIRGRIAMLDMGEPVRIVDLARNLLRLAGRGHLNGKGIVYTGLRPGEKLHEELVAPEEATSETSIPKVRIISTRNRSGVRVCPMLPDWERELAEGRESKPLAFLAASYPGLQNVGVSGNGRRAADSPAGRVVVGSDVEAGRIPCANGAPGNGKPVAYEAAKATLRIRPATWLVTGAAGFIGSNLVEALLSLDQVVVGLDNFATGYQQNLDAVRESVGERRWQEFRFIEGDIRDIEICRQACDCVDYVLHHAALPSVPRSIQDPVVSNAVNIGGFLNMLVAARDAGVRRFVFAGSSSTYGDHPGLPKVEERIGKPLSPYAVNKYVNELYASVFERVYGLETVGLRYFNVFGRRQDPNSAYSAVIPKWIAAMLEGRPITIYGDGETSRDFCYIENVIQANVLAATASDPAATGEVYNIAYGGRTTLNQLFFMIRDGIATERPEVLGVEPHYAEFRIGDVRHSQADISKASERLGYVPTHSVYAGLSQTLAWYGTASSVRSTRVSIPAR